MRLGAAEPRRRSAIRGRRAQRPGPKRSAVPRRTDHSAHSLRSGSASSCSVRTRPNAHAGRLVSPARDEPTKTFAVDTSSRRPGVRVEDLHESRNLRPADVRRLVIVDARGILAVQAWPESMICICLMDTLWDKLVPMQEGELSVNAPAIGLSSEELVRTPGMPLPLSLIVVTFVSPP